MATIDALADEIARLAAACRVVADKGLKQEITAALRKAAEPVPADIRKALEPYLPDRYAAVLDADLKITISTRTGTDAGVTIQATAPTGRSRRGRAIPMINQGILRHPVYADRTAPRRSWTWRDQEVRPGFFDRPVQDAAPRVRREIENALDGINRQIWDAVHG